ncbi:trypsin-like peptidase domain-containing protein [uncultured Rhodospira sp.]|uniref:trypsin-like serine peptidase n=1 Tax=uncultured Rhodospira sp. TaxID=1936189 RepID=UPI00260A0959|nr:trypsin-like peptidase domain-containing protein [uncultured Rhodospira sp.]
MTTYVGDDTDVYPYSAVVYVEATFPDGSRYSGSGFLVGPNDVLTASHVIYDVNEGGVATSVTVTPGLDGGYAPYGAHAVAQIDYLPVDADGDGYLSTWDSRNDFALLALETDVASRTGLFALDYDGGSALYNVTGYPGVYATAEGPRMTNDSGYVVENMLYSNYEFVSVETNPGNSGGPLWTLENGTATAVGFVSTSGWATDVASQEDLIKAWIAGNDDLITVVSDNVSGSGGDSQADAVVTWTNAAGIDEDWYLTQYADVADAGMTPVSHYNQFGWAEGRDPNAFFDSDGYLSVYQDVAATGMNPLSHYLDYGWREDRDPSARFDTSLYETANSDVAAAGINPLLHFLDYGAAEGRSIAASEDPAWQAIA